MALNLASVTLNVSATIPIGTSGTLGTATIGSQLNTNYETGVADGNADTAYAATVSVNTSASIDFSAGTITQPDGSVATFAEITTIRLTYKTGSGILTIGGGSNPIVGIAGTLEKAGDTFVLHKPTSGIVVTNSTADKLNLSSSSGAVTVDITALGRSS